MKIFEDIQLQVTLDPIYLSNDFLMIRDVEDLCLTHSTVFVHSEWCRIEEFFNTLISQSSSGNSLYLLVQLLQDYLSDIKRVSNINYSRQEPYLSHNESMLNIESNNKKLRTNGFYKFDLSTRQWIPCSTDSTSENLFIERWLIVHWNLAEMPANIDSNDRWATILKILYSTEANIICLREVNEEFQECLLNERWIQNENYCLILYGVGSNIEMILLKNIWPNTCEIKTVDSLMITLQFSLSPTVVIDLVCLRVSDLNDDERLRLRKFFKTRFERNYFLLYDVDYPQTISDDDQEDEGFLSELYENNVEDLWLKHVQSDEQLKTCPVYVKNRIRTRSGRFYFHSTRNLIGTVNFLGLPDHPLTNSEDFYRSARFPLQCSIDFRPRRFDCRSSLAVIPPRDKVWFDQSIPHIKLVSRFFHLENIEDDVQDFLLPLRLLLSQFDRFVLNMRRVEDSNRSQFSYRPMSSDVLENLQRDIRNFFSIDDENSNRFEMNFERSNQEQLPESFQFSVNFLYLLKCDDENCNGSVEIVHQIPIGRRLKSIDVDQSESIADDLQRFFTEMNFYDETRRSIEKRHEKLICLEKLFNSIETARFSLILLPYGSFRLGVSGDDLDLLLLICPDPIVTDPVTSFDQQMLERKSDVAQLSKYFVDFLHEQLNGMLIHCYEVIAVHPIISLLFNDETPVDLSIKFVEDNSKKSLENFLRPIHGIHDVERALAHVPSPLILQHLLTFVRRWAQQTGIYGQTYGYLSGVSWFYLCAWLLQSSNETASIFCNFNEFCRLVERFFTTFSQWNWSKSSIQFPTKSFVDSNQLIPMEIICPVFPFSNSARSTTESSSRLIQEKLSETALLWRTGRSDEDVLRSMFSSEDFFPHRTVRSIFKLIFYDCDSTELDKTAGWIKSHLVRFVRQCEDNCRLFVQTDSSIRMTNVELERVFFFGFDRDAETLAKSSRFSSCVQEFFIKLNANPSPRSQMKIFYKFYSRKT